MTTLSRFFAAALLLGGSVTARAAQDIPEQPTEEATGMSQEALQSGTCTKGAAACIGVQMYTSPNGGVSYCDPNITFDGACYLVEKGRCALESVSNCPGMPRGTRCNSGRGFCKFVEEYRTMPTAPCGCF